MAAASPHFPMVASATPSPSVVQPVQGSVVFPQLGAGAPLFFPAASFVPAPPVLQSVSVPPQPLAPPPGPEKSPSHVEEQREQIRGVRQNLDQVQGQRVGPSSPAFSSFQPTPTTTLPPGFSPPPKNPVPLPLTPRQVQTPPPSCQSFRVGGPPPQRDPPLAFQKPSPTVLDHVKKAYKTFHTVFCGSLDWVLEGFGNGNSLL